MTCNAEASSVERLTKQLEGRADVYGVAWGGDEPAFQDFVDRYALTFPQVSDSDGELYARFGVITQPAFVIVAPDGDTTVMPGALDEDEIDSTLDGVTG